VYRLNTTAVSQSVADVPNRLKSHPTPMHSKKIENDLAVPRKCQGTIMMEIDARPRCLAEQVRGEGGGSNEDEDSSAAPA
jgi:hypothetical protein